MTTHDSHATACRATMACDVETASICANTQQSFRYLIDYDLASFRTLKLDCDIVAMSLRIRRIVVLIASHLYHHDIVAS